MIPTPTQILETVKALCDCGAEFLRWAQTKQGQAVIEQVLKDRAGWDKFWADAGVGAKRLFSGELFK